MITWMEEGPLLLRRAAINPLLNLRRTMTNLSCLYGPTPDTGLG